MDVGSGWFLENKLILWDLFCLVIFIKIKKKKASQTCVCKVRNVKR